MLVKAQYALEQFGKLSQAIDRDSPVLVSKAMDYMHEHSEKFVIIVMDGMSEFDWRVLSTSFNGIKYEQSAAFAMIPSTTSISRQCLLSNKYPSQLMEPWKQSKEKAEFIACAKSLGYTDTQIGYERGYDAAGKADAWSAGYDDGNADTYMASYDDTGSVCSTI